MILQRLLFWVVKKISVASFCLQDPSPSQTRWKLSGKISSPNVILETPLEGTLELLNMSAEAPMAALYKLPSYECYKRISVVPVLTTNPNLTLCK